MTPNVFTLPIPHSHFPPSFPSIISVKTFLISVLWNLYGHAHSVSASARATALLGNFQEVGYLEKRCYGVIYLFFPYSSIFQVLRMAWISSFLFFFFFHEKYVDNSYFETVLSKKKRKKAAVSNSLKQSWLKYLIFFCSTQMFHFPLYDKRTGSESSPLTWH